MTVDVDDADDDGMLSAIGTGTVCWIGVERFDDDVDDAAALFVAESLKARTAACAA